MKRTVLVAAFIFLSAFVRVPAADWPQWHGPNRDGVSAETGLLQEWPTNGPAIVWTNASVGNGYGSVAVADGTVYIAGAIDGEGRLTALTTDGKAKWTHVYGAEHAGMYPGARCTPTAHDGLVYVVSGPGVVSCVKAGAGDPVWKRDMVADFNGRPSIKWGFGESVLIDGDRVICTPAGSNVTCVALNRKTGETIWRSPGLDQRHAMCSPVLLEHGKQRFIVTQVVRHIVGLSAKNGELLWTFEMLQNNHHDDAVKTFTPICADGHVFVSCGGTKLGSVKLRLSDDGRSVTAAWSQPRFRTGIGGAVLCQGRLYGVAGREGWACVDWQTGGVLHVSDGVLGKKRRGACIVADGMLYCRGLNGRFDLVRILPDRLVPAGSFTVPAPPKDKHWAHPAIANGVLFVRHKGTLLALDCRAKRSAGHANERRDTKGVQR